jgi:hypothetical protein
MTNFVELVAQTTTLRQPDWGTSITDFDVSKRQMADPNSLPGIGAYRRSFGRTGGLPIDILYDQPAVTVTVPGNDEGGLNSIFLPTGNETVLLNSRFDTSEMFRVLTPPALGTTAESHEGGEATAYMGNDAIAIVWGPADPAYFLLPGTTLFGSFLGGSDTMFVWGSRDVASVASSGVTLSCHIFEDCQPLAVDPIDEFSRFCEAALRQKAGSMRRSVIDGLRRRLSELLSPEDWEHTDRMPSKESFWQLLRLLAKYPELRTPALTITADGSFVATWLRGHHEMVRLEFDEIGWVKWLVLLAPVGSIDRSEQGTGRVPLDKIYGSLDIFRVWPWMSSPKSA